MRFTSGLLIASSLALLDCTPPPSPAAAPAASAADDPRALASVSRPGAHPVPLADLFHITTFSGADPSPDGAHVVYSGNADGRFTLWIADTLGGPPRQLTHGDQRQGGPSFSPDGATIVFHSDHDGDEQWDLFRVHADGTSLENLTSTPDVSERGAVFSPDGRSIAFLSKAKTAASTEIAILDLQTRAIRSVTSGTPAGLTHDRPVFSADGKRLAYAESDGAEKNSNVYVVDLASGAKTLVTPHEGEHAFSPAAFSPDGTRLLVGSNAKNGQDGVALIDLATKALTWVVSDAWPSNPGAFSPDGRTIAFSHASDGDQEIALHDVATKATRVLALAKGMNDLVGRRGPFSRDGSRLFFWHDGADSPRSVWAFDVATGAAHAVTRALPTSIAADDLVPCKLVHYPSSDGRFTISALVYVPHNLPRDGHGAAVVFVHGGPTAQILDSFDPSIQSLVTRGYVVIAPNFRGSSGYGEAFQFANKRDWGGGDLADVRDAGEWVKKTGFVDPEKVAIMGRSYGGYMTMMGLTKQPGDWAAGVSIVPFVNLFTEFAHEDAELREYDRQFMGDPEANKALWEDRSPVNFLDRIRAPLLLLAGGNDPRDPPDESIQVAEGLKKRGAVVDIKVYADEGHSFSRTENRIDADRRVAEFLEKYVPPR
jgi:dipeptidyl aminopeptidase/acylaminoacyl peptidase